MDSMGLAPPRRKSNKASNPKFLNPHPGRQNYWNAGPAEKCEQVRRSSYYLNMRHGAAVTQASAMATRRPN
ncbi:unnamed protein product [Cutaneotrichosporon oleaginosum]